MISRRSILAGLAAAAVAVPTIRVQAQQAAPPAAAPAAAPAVPLAPGPMRRVAIASGTIPADAMLEANGGDAGWLAFFNEMKAQGFVSGTNVTYERVSGARVNMVRRLQGNTWNALGTNVAGTKPDLIVTNNSFIARGANTAADTIPIVFALGDAQTAGLVQPGSSLTGVSGGQAATREAMRIALLKEAVPAATKVAYLLKSQAESPTAWGAAMIAAATGAGATPAFYEDVRDDAGIDLSAYLRAFMDAQKAGANGIAIAEAVDSTEWAQTFGAYSLALKLPGIAPWRDYVIGGGLMSFGANANDMMKTAGTVAARILKGEKASAIPVVVAQPELVVSQRNAKNLGLTLPAALVAKAKEVLM